MNMSPSKSASFDPIGVPATFEYCGTELEAMAHAPNYYNAIKRRFAPHLGRRVLEVGAGVGTFSALLARDRTIENLTLLEPALNNFPTLSARFSGDSRVRVLQGYLEEYSARLSADAMVLVNVLEHVPDDVRLLQAAHQVLAPGGRILIFVPAVQALYGSLDEAFDHHRRYSLGLLRDRLTGAGFRIRKIHYMNLPGVLSWFIAGRVLRRRTLSPRDVRTYDRWVVPWMVKLESMHAPPIGQSLLAIAEARKHR
jgi:SAM-dependent methyltransferase